MPYAASSATVRAIDERVVVVGRASPGRGVTRPNASSSVEQLVVDLGGGEQLAAGEPQPRGVGARTLGGSGSRRRASATRGTVRHRWSSGGGSRPRSMASRCSRITLSGRWWSRCRPGRSAAARRRRWCTCGSPPAVRSARPAPRLEVAELAELERREVRAQPGVHLADVHAVDRGAADAARLDTGVTVPAAVWPAKNTSRNLPICTSSPSWRTTVVDAVAVDVGAVEAADVADGEAVGLAAELGVPARDRDVVEEDLAVRVAAGGDHVGVEQEPAARARAALHDEQRAARRAARRPRRRRRR